MTPEDRWCGFEWEAPSRSGGTLVHHGCALPPGHSTDRKHRCLCGAEHANDQVETT